MALATFSHKGRAMAQAASRWPLLQRSCFDHESDHVIFEMYELILRQNFD